MDQSIAYPDPRAKRALKARGHQLKAILTLGRQGVSDAFIEEVSHCFDATDLIKVRIAADDAAETQSLAEAIAARVPCHFIQRVGRVVLFYHPQKDAPQV